MGVWSYDFVEAQTDDGPQAQAHDVDGRVYSLSPFAMGTFSGNRTTRGGRRSPGAGRRKQLVCPSRKRRRRCPQATNRAAIYAMKMMQWPLLRRIPGRLLAF